MAQWLRARTALPEDPSLVPSTNIGLVIPSPEGSNAALVSLGTHAHVHTTTQLKQTSKENTTTTTITTRTTKAKPMVSTPEDFLGLKKVNEIYTVRCGRQLSGLAMLTQCKTLTLSSILRTTKPNSMNESSNKSSSG